MKTKQEAQERPVKFLVLHAYGLGRERRVPVSGYIDAMNKWRDWRDQNQLGGSMLKGHAGDLVDDAGGVLARISYNGRIWSPEPNNPACLFDPFRKEDA